MRKLLAVALVLALVPSAVGATPALQGPDTLAVSSTAGNDADTTTPTTTTTDQDDDDGGPRVVVVTQSPATSSSSSSSGGESETTSASDALPAGGDNNAQTLDNITAVTRAVYDEQNGTAIIVLESQMAQRVVVTDAGGVWEGGRIAQVERTIPTGRAVIRIPVTEYNSMVGVTIGTRSGLYGVPIQDDSGSFWPEHGSDRAALLIGTGLPVGLAVAWKRRKDKKGDVGVTEV